MRYKEEESSSASNVNLQLLLVFWKVRYLNVFIGEIIGKFKVCQWAAAAAAILAHYLCCIIQELCHVSLPL